MDSMKCYSCLYKHLAGALSYAKEMQQGKNRLIKIDLLGQLVNAQHHAELICLDLTGRIKGLRTKLQGNDFFVDGGVINEIRELYSRAQRLQKGQVQPRRVQVVQTTFSVMRRNEMSYSVVIDSPDDMEKFVLCCRLFQKNCTNKHQIFVLNPKIQVDGLRVLTGKLVDNLEVLTENFVYLKQNSLLLRGFDFNYMVPMVFYGPSGPTYDFGCPQLLNKSIFRATAGRIDESDMLNSYFTNNAPEQAINALRQVVMLNKKICCSNKYKIGVVNFATYTNEQAYASVKQWVEKNVFENEQ